MADRPIPLLTFDAQGCPGCGARRVPPPAQALILPDDFDWAARDFESIRAAMLGSLAHDNPERTSWRAADMEVTLVELLASGLDRLSHSIDVAFGERFLATARWPRSIVRHLALIDGVTPALAALFPLLSPDERRQVDWSDPAQTQNDLLLRLLTAHPQLIDTARAAGIADVDRIESLVTLSDLETWLRSVPVFAQVRARAAVEGGITVYEAFILCEDSRLRLHDRVNEITAGQQDMIDWAQQEQALLTPPSGSGLSSAGGIEGMTPAAIATTSLRTLLMLLAEPLLPLGVRLRLVDGRRAGVMIRLCIDVDPTFFRSEVAMAVEDLLSNRPGAFFDQANFGFGQPLYLSDLQSALMALPGVRGVIVSALRIVGDPATEATGTGILLPRADTALVLDAANPGPDSGYYSVTYAGGLIG
jgi:hypothetical protein